MQCTSCQKAVGDELVCQCGAILPPRSKADKFAQLGVPRRYSLSPQELEARHRELSRRLHPDRFGRAEARERMLSLQAATALNDAYRTLRAPLRRAEYLLALEGIEIGENTEVNPELLTDILELREELAEAKGAGNRARVEALAADVRERNETAMSNVARLFTAFDADGDRSHLAQIKEELVELRYFQRFLDEVEAGGEAHVEDL